MSVASTPRANPFGDLDDFAPQSASKPVPADTIEEIAQSSGFPSRQARGELGPPLASESIRSPVAERAQRRRTTGRNRQINIKATEETITMLYRIADDLDLPLGAVLERALDALKQMGYR